MCLRGELCTGLQKSLHKALCDYLYAWQEGTRNKHCKQKTIDCLSRTSKSNKRLSRETITNQSHELCMRVSHDSINSPHTKDIQPTRAIRSTHDDIRQSCLKQSDFEICVSGLKSDIFKFGKPNTPLNEDVPHRARLCGQTESKSMFIAGWWVSFSLGAKKYVNGVLTDS